MGQTPGEIEAEIESLRHETEVIVAELERRVSPRNLLRGVAGTVSDAAGSLVGEAEASLPEAMKQKEALLGGVALGLLSGLSLPILSSALLGRHSAAAELEFDRTLEPRGRAELLAERVDEALVHAIEQARRVHDVRVSAERGGPGMLKRLLWAALAGGMAALGSMLFKQMTASFWRGTMREEPPKK